MNENCKGFTLVEALVATLLTVMAVMTVASMSLTAFERVHRSGETTSAINLAEQRIEWLRNQPFSSGALSAGTTAETLSGDFDGFTRLTSIIDNTPTPGVKQIQVTATTPAGRSVQLLSLIGK